MDTVAGPGSAGRVSGRSRKIIAHVMLNGLAESRSVWPRQQPGQEENDGS